MGAIFLHASISQSCIIIILFMIDSFDAIQEGAAKVLSEVKSRPPAERVQRTPQRAISTSRSAHSSPSRFGFRKNSLRSGNLFEFFSPVFYF